MPWISGRFPAASASEESENRSKRYKTGQNTPSWDIFDRNGIRLTELEPVLLKEGGVQAGGG